MNVWPSMFEDNCRKTLITRLRSLTPETERQWGRMTQTS